MSEFWFNPIVASSVVGGALFVGLLLLFRSTETAAATRKVELVRAAHSRSRAERSSEDADTPEGIGSRLLAALGAILAGLSRVRADEVEGMRSLLLEAGFDAPIAVRVYSGGRILLELTLFVAAANVGQAYDLEVLGFVSLLLFAFACGRVLPEYLLSGLRKRRQSRMLAVLPEFMDLLMICLSGGLGVREALARVCDETIKMEPTFGVDLRRALLEVEAGKSLRDAMKRLSDRYGSPELRALLSVVVQSERYGSGVAETLEEYAEMIRATRLSKIEARAETVPSKMLFPTMLILLSTLAAVVVPLFWRVNNALVR